MVMANTSLLQYGNNGTAYIGHECRKTTVLNCHRCLINTGVEKNELYLNIYFNLFHQMSLSKSKCWYSNNCLHFFKAMFHCNCKKFYSKGANVIKLFMVVIYGFS